MSGLLCPNARLLAFTRGFYFTVLEFMFDVFALAELLEPQSGLAHVHCLLFLSQFQMSRSQNGCSCSRLDPLTAPLKCFSRSPASSFMLLQRKAPESAARLVFLPQVPGKCCTYIDIFAITQNCFQRALTNHTRKGVSKLFITHHLGPKIP